MKLITHWCIVSGRMTSCRRNHEMRHNHRRTCRISDHRKWYRTLTDSCKSAYTLHKLHKENVSFNTSMHTISHFEISWTQYYNTFVCVNFSVYTCTPTATNSAFVLIVNHISKRPILRLTLFSLLTLLFPYTIMHRPTIGRSLGGGIIIRKISRIGDS